MNEEETLSLKIGDRVRLTGENWDGYGGFLKVGDVVTVTLVTDTGKAYAGEAKDVLSSGGFILPSYEIEKVEEAAPAPQVVHSLASVTEGIRELIAVLTSTGILAEDARDIIMSNIETRLD